MAKKRVQVGTIFLVPRLDGKFVLGQALFEWEMGGVFIVAIFDSVYDCKDIKIEDIPQSPKCIAMPSIFRSEITRGFWKKIGEADLLESPVKGLDYPFIMNNDYIGASTLGGKIVENLINAYFGLTTWEPYPAQVGYLRSLLLPDVVPPNDLH